MEIVTSELKRKVNKRMLFIMQLLDSWQLNYERIDDTIIIYEGFNDYEHLNLMEFNVLTDNVIADHIKLVNHLYKTRMH